MRRLLENGANSSFVHQLADESIGMDVLLTSPLWFESRAAFPLPPALYGPSRPNSLGLDLTVQSMRAPLLEAFETVQVPDVQEFYQNLASSRLKTGVNSYQKWSNIAVSERAKILRKAADSLEQQTPRFCALLVKEPIKLSRSLTKLL